MGNDTDACEKLCLHYGRWEAQLLKGVTEKACAVRLEKVVPIPSYRIQLMIKVLRKPEMQGNVLNLKNGF